MRAIDIHAHISPGGALDAIATNGEWHGLTAARLRQIHQYNPRTLWTPQERLKDMDSLGVDVHVLSTAAQFYFYEEDAAHTAAMHRECNDYVADLTRQYPTRFAGLANLPMQDVGQAVTELERSVAQLGLKGAMIGDHVNGVTYDDPRFYPLWRAAEQLNAVFLIHQSGGTLVSPRLNRYHLPNTIGNLADRAVTFASFVFGGVMDKFPNLKICLCHAGGYTCYGIGRMDRGWEVRPEARQHIQQPPSAYLNRFYYDCLTHSEPALRYLIDAVGIDQVVFGTDWPFDMCFDWPTAWVLGLESLTQQEKEAILHENLENLLGI
ncbi:MAG: amidohydrolase [Chloroflexi bacterium]|nr:amidohydrolase [Chloroflexota bacterium]MBI4197779.1 amidohydrolase [Chloroflexota bacterium]